MCELHHNAPSSEPRLSISGFVDELVVAITNGRIYWNEHPRVKSSIASLKRGLQNLLAHNGRERIEIGSFDGYLIVEERPLLGASLSAPRIIRPLSELGSGGIAFEQGAEDKDFSALIELLGRRDLEDLGLENAGRVLRESGVKHVGLLPPYSEENLDLESEKDDSLDFEYDDPSLLSLEIPIHLYQSVVDLLQDVMIRACRGDQITPENAMGFVEAILKQLEDDSKTLMSISRYERYDAFTFGHSIRVSFLALNFARNLTDDYMLLQRIGLAALLHDIGKAWVPFEILHSTSRLTNEERVEMNKHTIHGGEILMDMEPHDAMSAAIAFGHHKKLDNTGYPHTIHETQLSTATKIVKICDVYEALTAVRPYKASMTPLRAFRVMMTMDQHFDPALLKQFIRHVGVYPVGSRVRLESGETARVVRQSDAFLRPVVQLERAEGGHVLAKEDCLELDLSTLEPGHRRQAQEIVLASEG